MSVSRRMQHVRKSRTLAITDRAKALARQGVDVISLSAGEPDFDTPSHVKEAAVRAIEDGFTKYTPSTGVPELKEAICQKLNRENGGDYEPSQVVVTCGGKYAVFSSVLALCEEGDEVLIISPYWVSYPEMVRLAGAQPLFLRSSEEQYLKVDASELERALTPRTKMVIFNNPSNPTGVVHSRDELTDVVELLAQRGIYVLADEIYEKIVYDDIEFVSLAGFEQLRDKLIVVNGFSKAYAMTGWRVGYLAAPLEVASAVSTIVGHSTSNATSVSQMAALAALTGDQSCVETMRREFARRREYVYSRLREIQGIHCHLPKGAFYVFPEVRHFLARTGGPTDSFGLCDFLLEDKHVAVVPGGAFGADGHIRISYASSMEHLGSGLDRIAEGLLEL